MRLVLLLPTRDDPEAGAAVDWARSGGYDVVPQSLGGAPPAALESGDIVWCHSGSVVPSTSPAWCETLRDFTTAGGAILLSLLATPIACDLGATNERPNVEKPSPWRNDDDPLWDAAFRDWPDYPHIRGMQGWGEHPLFDGLQRGTFTWTATEGEPVSRTYFRRPHWPTGRVLGVDRAYVRLDASTAVAWEYDAGAGRILCLGANVCFTARDARLDPQRDRLLINALAYLDPRRDTRRVRREYWPAIDERTTDTRERSGSLAPLVSSIALPTSGAMPAGILELAGDARTGVPYTIAGRRALVLGDEGRGVVECWIHPLCVSQEIVPTVAGAALRAVSVRVTPSAVERTLVDLTGATWRELVAVSPEQPHVHYELAAEGAGGPAASIDLRFRVRLEWPFPSDSLHPLTSELSRDGARVALVVRGADGRTQLRIAVDGVDAATLLPSPASPRLAITLAPGQGLRLAMTATAEGESAAAGEWRALAADAMPATLARLWRRDAERRDSTVHVSTPSASFDEAWEWAKARLASFVVHVPGVGTGLTAGYATSRPGWSDARPGYAWFFGRDACWSGEALLVAGMFAEARMALEFLAATADVTGKIAHEVTTSGVAHYDAADATPLWLRFVAQYADWSGDLATVRRLWDRVRAAFDFVVSHPAAGLGLPGNIGIGHGWIESGPLGGGSVTSYVASIWIDALRRLVPLAETIGDRDLARRASEALDYALHDFEQGLRDPTTHRVALQLQPDGSRATTLTALAAVPILLGVDANRSADDVVTALAGDDLCTPWGVRMIGRSDARYQSNGYHSGAVWPLYTGWAALASFARHRPDLGWRHLSSVAARAFARERGSFDEVLDGDTGDAAGICSDQAWSAAMVIAPFITGLLGMQPRAASNRCVLDPCWPEAWDSLRVSGLRVGASRFSVELTRVDVAGSRTSRISLQLEEGAPLTVQVGTGRSMWTGTLTMGTSRLVTMQHRHEAIHERR